MRTDDSTKQPGGDRQRYWAGLAVAGLLLSVAPAAARVFPTTQDPQGVARMKSSVSYVMSIPEDQLVALVPPTSGTRFTDCPNCESSTQDQGRFEWTPRQPEQIRCKDCGEVYPGNARYPDDQYIEVKAPHGVHKLHYYEQDDGYRIFFRSHANLHARNYLQNICADLGELYAATGDEQYARRAALILMRFAELYPGYPYEEDSPFSQKVFVPYDQPWIEGAQSWRVARWYWWAYGDISQDLVRAYDAIKDWPGLEPMVGPEGVERIERDLLGAMAEYVLSIPPNYSNMSPTVWRSGLYAGRVLEQPAWIHEVVRQFETFLERQFRYDGHWYEPTAAYGMGVVKGLDQIIEAAKGYTDPPGYHDPQTGRRFDDLDLTEAAPLYRRALRALKAPRLPDGRVLPVNDTWVVPGAGRVSRFEPRQRMEPVLLPGLGAGVLGGGEGGDQFHAHLNFTTGDSHKHRDALSIGLFAFGKELLPDIGYTHTRYRRAWANATMSHNTVVMDGQESGVDRHHTGHRLLAYAARDGFQLVAAESDTAYEQAERYRRTLVMVGTDSTDGYLIDVFEVAGGAQHDYLLHGSADEDSTARISGADLTPYPGTLMNPGVTFTPPKGERDHPGPGAAYALVRDLSRADASGRTVTLSMQLAESPDLGLRTFLACEPDTTLYLGQAPSIRRAGERDNQLDQTFAPAFVARRAGEAGLRSTFVAVHEPTGPGRTGAIERVEVHRRPQGLIVAVHRGQAGTDWLLMSFTDQASLVQTSAQGRVAMQGHYGLVRTGPGGAVDSAHLIGGRRLSFGDFTLEQPTAMSRGMVTAVGRSGGEDGHSFFEVNQPLEGDASAYPLLRLTLPDGSARGYNVVRVEPGADGTRVHVAESAGLRMEGGQIHLTSYPQRSIDGAALRYDLLRHAAFKGR